MQKKSSQRAMESIEFVRFGILEACKKVKHGVFLRQGGVSTTPYDSLNCGFGTDDCKKNVEENQRRALAALEIEKYAACYQTHSNVVVRAEKNINIADGLLTNEKNLGLIVKHADCQAALFYDPINHALANVHCGWRGNVKNIYHNTIEQMKACFGSKPENMLVCISPSLGPEASEFVNFQKELPREFYPFQFKPTYFNLWEISFWQLCSSGILPKHIEIAKICTFSNPQSYFSYRRAKNSGRHATIAALI